MKTYLYVLFMFVFAFFSCKPVSVIDLQQEYLKSQIKLVQNGGDSQYDIQTLQRYLGYTDSVSRIKPRCPIGPLPGPRLNGVDILEFTKLKRIVDPTNGGLIIEVEGMGNTEFIRSRPSKCMPSEPMYILSTNKLKGKEIIVRRPFPPASDGMLVFPVAIAE